MNKIFTPFSPCWCVGMSFVPPQNNTLASVLCSYISHSRRLTEMLEGRFCSIQKKKTYTYRHCLFFCLLLLAVCEKNVADFHSIRWDTVESMSYTRTDYSIFFLCGICYLFVCACFCDFSLFSLPLKKFHC